MVKMKIGPDGSLCRITSSAKDICNKIRIVKMADNELKKSDEIAYKLVAIDAEEKESESSEKSEDLNEKEESETAANIETHETDKDIKSDKVSEVKSRNKKREKKYGNNRFKLKKRQGKRNRRKYGMSGNVGKSCQDSLGNAPKNVNVWLNGCPPPFFHNNQFSPSFMDYRMYSPLNSVPKGSRKSVGLLGDSPYDHQSTFYSNSHGSSFNINQNLFNNEYHANNFQRSLPTTPVYGNSGLLKNYQHNRSDFRRGRNRKNSSSWNQHHTQNQRGRSCYGN